VNFPPRSLPNVGKQKPNNIQVAGGWVVFVLATLVAVVAVAAEASFFLGRPAPRFGSDIAFACLVRLSDLKSKIV
jgi:hypothetical protein